MSTIEEQACVYAALILHADDLPITGDKIATILRAANVTVEPFWPGLFAMALEGVNVANLISSVACSVGDGAPAASAAPSGDAPVAAGSSAMNKGDNCGCGKADDREFALYAEMLSSADATSEELALSYFRRLLAAKAAPPEHVDRSVVDAFIRVVRDESRSSAVRMVAAQCARKVVCAHASDAHEIRVAVLDELIKCIQREKDEAVFDQCVLAVYFTARHCAECERAVDESDTLRSIVKRMHEGRVASLYSNQYALSCCALITNEGKYKWQQEEARLLPSVVSQALNRFKEDDKIRMFSVALVVNLSVTDAWIATEGKEKIDLILKEPNLLSTALLSIATADSCQMRGLCLVNVLILYGTFEQVQRVITSIGFMRIIGGCLDSKSVAVPRVASLIIGNAAQGPMHHTEMILKLSRLFHHPDLGVQNQACRAIANLLLSFNYCNPRPEERADFIVTGVQQMVDIQAKLGVDSQLMNEIKEILPSLLISHNLFWSAFETAYDNKFVHENCVKEEETEIDDNLSIAFIIAEAQ